MAYTLETDSGINNTVYTQVYPSSAKAIVFDYDSIAVEIKNLISKRDILLTTNGGELGKLKSIFNDLINAWSGKDSEAFVNKYNSDYQPYIEQVVKEINTYINSLEAVSKKLQEVEDTLSAL